MSLDGVPTTSPRRRRQRQQPQNDYYDDDSSDEEKGKSDHVYKGACSIGQFFLNPCVCIVTSMDVCCRPLFLRVYLFLLRVYQRKQRRDIAVAVAVIFLFTLWKARRRRPYHFPLRPANDKALDALPVNIGSLDLSKIDLGGWRYPRSSFPRLKPLDESKIRDYGGLIFKSLQDSANFYRTIAPDDDVDYEFHRQLQIDKMDEDLFLREYYDYDDELESQECRRPNWKSLYFPNCNVFHEMDLERDYNPKTQPAWENNYDSYRFSHGYYRDAWMVVNPFLKDAIVLKTTKMLEEFDFGRKNMLSVQRDAIIMERLTSSPNIVSMYGICGTSLTVQPLPYNVEEYIVPGTGYMKQKEFDGESQNTYTPTEKLHMALEMAESLAELHGYKGGVIVHDDVQLVQWMRSSDDKLVLGDFNRAEIMDYNEQKGEYCTYENGGAYGNYRAPEEMADGRLNEKIDVYSFGNNIYALLTGLWVFYENNDDEYVQKQVMKGRRAFIDERYRTRSFAEGKLVEVMERCWEQNPADRAEIFEVTRTLRQAVQENQKFQKN